MDSLTHVHTCCAPHYLHSQGSQVGLLDYWITHASIYANWSRELLIYIYLESISGLMKRHQFDLVALLLLQSSTLFHKSWWFASIRELGTGFVCYDLGKKDIETLFFISFVIQLSLPFSTRHAFPLSFCLLKRILVQPFLFTLGFLHLPYLDFGLLKWLKLHANTLLL